jgi:hypothetical protein
MNQDLKYFYIKKKFLIIFIFFLFFINNSKDFSFSSHVYGNESQLIVKNLNLQKIYKNKDKFFLERIFFEQIPDSFQNKKNFIFANQDGKLFFYDFSSNSSNLFFDLKKISNIDERKNKYKFDNIEIYRINDEQFLISSGNFLILFTKQSKGNFQTQWSLKTPYKINNNSIIINKDENYLVFSKSNNSIEARDLLDSSLKWFIEDSPIRSLRFSDYPVLFLKQNDLFAFFSKSCAIFKPFIFNCS